MTANPVKIAAIRGNLEALNVLLQQTASRTKQAAAHLDRGNYDNAIGILADLRSEQSLDNAQKLLGAALILHSYRPPTNDPKSKNQLH
jgi:hypothetical protein